MEKIKSINYAEVNSFMIKFSSFLKALKWNKENPEYAAKNVDKFFEKIVDPMDKAWDALDDDTKKYILKNTN